MSFFVDDTQTNLSFKVDNTTSQPKDIGTINSIDALRNWMIKEKLILSFLYVVSVLTVNMTLIQL